MSKKERGPANLLELLSGFVNAQVEETKLPTEETLGRPSTVGVYGGKLQEIEGKLVWTTTLASLIDRRGDRFLRNFDEHIMNRPFEMMRRHPKWFLKGITPGPTRYRGTPDKIVENATRLGLGDIYIRHPHGIEITKPAILTKGCFLQDIFRQDIIQDSELLEVDRFNAVAQTGQFIGEIHSYYGAVGEILTNDICFQELDNGILNDPILNLPDIIWNPDKPISDRSKKAIDILDILVSVSSEEYRRSKDISNIQRNIELFLQNYPDTDVIHTVGSFAKRGRLVMNGENFSSQEIGRELFSIHNKERLMIQDNIFPAQVRNSIIESCNEF